MTVDVGRAGGRLIRRNAAAAAYRPLAHTAVNPAGSIMRNDQAGFDVGLDLQAATSYLIVVVGSENGDDAGLNAALDLQAASHRLVMIILVAPTRNSDPASLDVGHDTNASGDA